MKKFKWKRTELYGKNGPITHVSNKMEILFHKQFMVCDISSRHNGTNSAYAIVYHTVEWPTIKEQHWYHTLSRHFKGRNSFQQAAAWCNYLLNNPPYYYSKGNGHIFLL